MVDPPNQPLLQSIRGGKSDEGRTGVALAKRGAPGPPLRDGVGFATPRTIVPTEALRRPVLRRRRSSCVAVQQWLTALVGHLPAGFGNLGAQLAQHGFGSSSQAKVCARNARRPTAELRQHKASHLVDHGFVRLTAHQFAPGLHQAQLQHLGLDRDVSGVCLTARRFCRSRRKYRR